MQHPAIGHDDAKSAVTLREIRTISRRFRDVAEQVITQMDAATKNGSGKVIYTDYKQVSSDNIADLQRSNLANPHACPN